jgi:hypothetical protein
MTTDQTYEDGAERPDQRLARNVNELLQELRVAQAGVQFLFGFLLAVTFTAQYERASGYQQVVHLVSVLFATVSVALLAAPAAWHRVLFRQGQRKRIVEVANVLAVTGMACLAVAMTATVLLLTDVVIGRWGSVVISVVTAAVFGFLWFVMPSRIRDNGDS